MLKRLFTLPTRLILRARVHYAAVRVQKRLRNLGRPYTDIDVGYTLAPDLVRICGVRKVKQTLILKMATGRLTATDIGVGIWVRDNHKVTA